MDRVQRRTDRDRYGETKMSRLKRLGNFHFFREGRLSKQMCVFVIRLAESFIASRKLHADELTDRSGCTPTKENVFYFHSKEPKQHAFSHSLQSRNRNVNYSPSNSPLIT